MRIETTWVTLPVGVGRCLEEGVGLGLSDDEIDYLLNMTLIDVGTN